MRITFIGGGNMANALIGGLKKQGYSAAGMQVVEPAEEARVRLTERYGVRCAASIDKASLSCDVLLLAIKPQQMKQALAGATGKLGQQLVISIAAGLRLDDISRWLGNHAQLVRAMPNTPALIGAGITGLFATPAVSREDCETADKIMQSVGRTVWLDDEALLDVVTAVSGSGPAYVFYFIEALENTGIELGLSPPLARLLALQTFVGASNLAAASKDSVAHLRQQVTSKGGTTAAALDVFANEKLGEKIASAIVAAAARGKELSIALGDD